MPCWGLDPSNSSNGEVHLHCLFGDSHADVDICALNLATFGGQTNIKSILLTLVLVWGGGSTFDPSPQWCLDVNGIDLLFV